jgi:hypothetical protein
MKQLKKWLRFFPKETKMRVGQIISFICGTVITGVIYFIFLFVYVLATFSLSGENLDEKENREAFVFFASLIISFSTVHVIIRKYKKGMKFTAAGIAFPAMLAVYLTFYAGIVYYENLNYYKSFDKQEWFRVGAKPFKTAKTLAKKKYLIGKEKEYVAEMLGPSGRLYKNNIVDYIIYPTDYDGWQLRLLFEYNKAKKAFLYQEGFTN